MTNTVKYPYNQENDMYQTVKSICQQTLYTKWTALLLVTAFFLLAINYNSLVSNASADPKYTLLVSQSILEYGSIKLDNYISISNLSSVDPNLIEHNGHLYYYFPIGTSVFVLPAVWVANQMGNDFSYFGREFVYQNIFASLINVLIFLTLYFIALTILEPRWSLFVSIVTMFGTGLNSVLGTALWSINLAVLFSLFSLFLTIQLFKKNDISSLAIVPYIHGFFLFAAFFSRPTSAIFILCTLVYITVLDKRYSVKVATISFLFLLGWLTFNYLEYGQWLSPYYSTDRFNIVDTPLLMIIYGHLASPSRGIFVFSPFLLIVAITIFFKRQIFANSLVVYCISWLLLHLLIISKGSDVPWWGGHSFGPRLFVDVIPALFIISLFFFRLFEDKQFSSPIKHLLIGSYTILAIVAIFINSFQGLYNIHTMRWHGDQLDPDPGLYNEWLFDWRYPQFLATPQNICDRHQEFMSTQLFKHNKYEQLRLYQIEEVLDHDADELTAIFIGWSRVQEGWRWSECAKSEIILGRTNATFVDNLQVSVKLSSETSQIIDVFVNDILIGQIEILEPSITPSVFQLPFNSNLLNENDTNRLAFYIPEANKFWTHPNKAGIRLESVIIGEIPNED